MRGAAPAVEPPVDRKGCTGIRTLADRAVRRNLGGALSRIVYRRVDSGWGKALGAGDPVAGARLPRAVKK